MAAAASSGGASQRVHPRGSLGERTGGTSRPVLAAACRAAAEIGEQARLNAACDKPQRYLSTTMGRAYDKSFIFSLVAALSYFEMRFPAADFPRETQAAKRWTLIAAEYGARPEVRSWRHRSRPPASLLNDDAEPSHLEALMRADFHSSGDNASADAPAIVPDVPTGAIPDAPGIPVTHRRTNEDDGAMLWQRGEQQLRATQPASQTAVVSSVTTTSAATSSLVGHWNTLFALEESQTDCESAVEQTMLDGRGGAWPLGPISLYGASGVAQEVIPPPSARLTLAADLQPLTIPSDDHAVTTVSSDFSKVGSAAATTDPVNVCLTQSAIPPAPAGLDFTETAPSVTLVASSACGRMGPFVHSCSRGHDCCRVCQRAAAEAAAAIAAAVTPFPTAAVRTEAAEAEDGEAVALSLPPDPMLDTTTPADEAASVLPRSCVTCLRRSWNSATGQWMCCRVRCSEPEAAGRMEPQPTADALWEVLVGGESKVNDLSSTEAAMAG